MRRRKHVSRAGLSTSHMQSSACLGCTCGPTRIFCADLSMSPAQAVACLRCTLAVHSGSHLGIIDSCCFVHSGFAFGVILLLCTVWTCFGDSSYLLLVRLSLLELVQHLCQLAGLLIVISAAKGEEYYWTEREAVTRKPKGSLCGYCKGLVARFVRIKRLLGCFKSQDFYTYADAWL